MNKKYLSYLFKNRKVGIIFFGVLYFAIILLTNLKGLNNLVSYRTNIQIAVLFSTGLAIALPVLQFSFVHQKKSVDTFFAIPCSRKEMLITNILFMWLITFGYFFVTTLFLTAFVISKVVFYRYLLFLLIAAILFLCLIVIHSCIYLFANNIFDGFVVLAAYMFLVVLFLTTYSIFITDMVAGISSGELGIGKYLSPFYLVVRGLWDDVEAWTKGAKKFDFLQYVLPIVYAAISSFLLKKHFIERKVERAEQLSNEFFAYPFVIHIYLFCFLLGIAFDQVRYLEWSETILMYLAFFFFYVVAQFVYQRKIEVKLKHVLIFAIGIALSYVVAFAAWQTRGFGRSDNYTIDEGKYVVYRYSAYVDKNDLGLKTTRDQDGVDISFVINVPLVQKAEYQEVISFFDTKRKDAIDYFYERKPGQDDQYNMLDIGNMDALNKTSWNDYYYDLRVPLSEEELKKLIPYFNESYAYDFNNGEEYELKDLLEK